MASGVHLKPQLRCKTGKPSPVENNFEEYNQIHGAVRKQNKLNTITLKNQKAHKFAVFSASS